MIPVMAPTFPPKGYPIVSAYMVVDGAVDAIDWYTRVLGAVERYRIPMPNGRLGHAELQIGDSVVMLADQDPDWQAYAPGHFGGSPISLVVYVPDVDAVAAAAVEAGATLAGEVKDQFYGDRTARITDPFGHSWSIATQIEQLSGAEIAERAKATFG